MGWDDGFERIRARMHDRRMYYRTLFLVEQSAPEPVRWWSLAWWRAPAKKPAGMVGPAAEYVLRDLAAYCYVAKPTLKVSQVTQVADPIAMAFAEGRRDVFNRIRAMCNLTSEQIDRIAHYRSQNDE